MQPMQAIFNARMEPIQTHEEYPKYARSETKPVVRARHIIDQGIISDKPCSACLALDQDCYRWEGTFSKCAYCTSKDKKKEFCHLPGQEALAVPEGRRKRRKITGNIYAPCGDAESIADTFVSGTIASATTPLCGVPMSNTQSVRPSPDSTSAMTGVIHTHVAPLAASEASSEACLERVTALETQVSNLEAKVLELLVKLDEVTSCATPQGQAAAGASPTTSDISLAHAPAPVSVATAARRATRVWVEGSKMPELRDASLPMQIAAIEMVGEVKESPGPKHTVEHPEGYRPVNCSCTASWSLDDAAIMRSETDAGAEANAFSVHGIASRGNLF